MSCRYKVVHFHRKPLPSHHSIEELFSSLREAMENNRFAVCEATLPNYSKGVWPRISNCRWAARHQGDVNHITGDVNYIAFSLPADRTILTIHDCHLIERLGGVRRKVAKALWFDLPIRRVRAVTVVSQTTRRQLIRHVPSAADKIVVIPNAVSKRFRPWPSAFNDARPRILQIGTKPNKNVTNLIRAISGIPCTLVIIGPVPASLENELASNHIDWESYSGLTTDEVYDVYKSCDIVAFVSTYEGFGMPVVEAQWVERPVVASNCSAMPEVAGRGACFVDPLDPASIRTGLLRVIHDHDFRAELLDFGRQNRKRFQLDEVAKQYQDLYAAVLAREKLPLELTAHLAEPPPTV